MPPSVSSFLRRLVSSPTGRGFRDSPLFFLLLGGGLVVLGLVGAATGELHARNGVIEQARMPGFFKLALLGQLGMGSWLSWVGWRRWQQHDT